MNAAEVTFVVMLALVLMVAGCRVVVSTQPSRLRVDWPRFVERCSDGGVGDGDRLAALANLSIASHSGIMRRGS